MFKKKMKPEPIQAESKTQITNIEQNPTINEEQKPVIETQDDIKVKQMVDELMKYSNFLTPNDISGMPQVSMKALDTHLNFAIFCKLCELIEVIKTKE